MPSNITSMTRRIKFEYRCGKDACMDIHPLVCRKFGVYREMVIQIPRGAASCQEKQVVGSIAEH